MQNAPRSSGVARADREKRGSNSKSAAVLKQGEQGIHSDPEKAIEAAFSTALGWLPGLERCPISQF